MKLFILFCLLQICFCKTVHRKEFVSDEASEENWTGRWLPERTTAAPSFGLTDNQHGIKMGIPTAGCDDAVSFLETDWDGDSTKYRCMDKKADFEPNINVPPLMEKQNIPVPYIARHICINYTIDYDDVIPTFGPHRPLWPRYGEYKYVPRQRWVHTLEHGGVVMLYHPCANKQQVNKLKELVSRCLWRHVITTMDTLSPERPLALVTWGWRLEMSFLDPGLARDFITLHALKGPERNERDGQYSVELIKPAEVITDNYDSYICKDMPGQMK